MSNSQQLIHKLLNYCSILRDASSSSCVVDELEAVASANLQSATRLRQSLLHKAFAGGLAGGLY
jgi:hypothetical protein